MIKSILGTIGFIVAGCLGGILFARFSTPIYRAEGAANVVQLHGSDGTGQTSVAAMMAQQSILSRAAETSGYRSSQYSRDIHISAPQTGNVVVIAVEGPDPSLAAKMVNSIVKKYNSAVIDSNLLLRQNFASQLANQKASEIATYNAATSRIAAIETATGILDISQKVKHISDYQQTLEELQNQEITESHGLSTQIEKETLQLSKLPKMTSSNIVEGANPNLASFNQDLQNLQQKRINLLENYLETSQKVQDVEVQIKATKAAMAKANAPALTVQSQETTLNPERTAIARQKAQDEAQLANVNASLKAIGTNLSLVNQKAKSMPTMELQMSSLEKQRDTADKNVQSISDQQSAIVQNGAPGEQPIVNLFTKAIPPEQPFWPDYKKLESYGAGIGLGFGVLFGIVTWPRKVNVVQPQPALAGYPNYQMLGGAKNFSQDALPVSTQSGTTPALPSRTIVPPLIASRGTESSSISLPGASPAEAFRFLVFSFQSRSEDSDRTVLFTSVSSDSLSGDAAAQFAVAMAQTGTRTLLADCNLHEDSLTKSFGFTGKSGVSDVLCKTMLPVPSSDLMLQTNHEGLFFLPCGTEESEGLASYQNQQIKGLVEEFQSKASVKVINTAPCTMVADAPRLIKYVDDVCLVASVQDEKRGLIEKARAILQLAGAEKVDIILVDPKASRHSLIG